MQTIRLERTHLGKSVPYSYRPLENSNIITRFFHFLTRSTNLTLKQQLDAGVRYFEFWFEFWTDECWGEQVDVVHPTLPLTYKNTERGAFSDIFTTFINWRVNHMTKDPGDSIVITIRAKHMCQEGRVVDMAEDFLRMIKTDCIPGIIVNYQELGRWKMRGL